MPRYSPGLVVPQPQWTPAAPRHSPLCFPGEEWPLRRTLSPAHRIHSLSHTGWVPAVCRALGGFSSVFQGAGNLPPPFVHAYLSMSRSLHTLPTSTLPPPSIVRLPLLSACKHVTHFPRLTSKVPPPGSLPLHITLSYFFCISSTRLETSRKKRTCLTSDPSAVLVYIAEFQHTCID